MARIRGGREWTRSAHYDEVRAMLGLPDGAKLPAEGMPPRRIQGIMVWVTPLMGPRVPRRVGRWGRVLERKSSRHRVLAQCPDCGKVLSVGRLGQHKCRG